MPSPAPSAPLGPRVAIVGGGLAGLAAATALVQRGCRVELFESRRKLGGRAGSYQDRTTGASVDHCQHVAMGCCTNYLDFCCRTGIAELLTRHDTLHFFGPNGRRCDFRPSRWLPAPLHLVGALLGLEFLSLRERLSIARAMLRLVRTPPTDSADGPTVQAWLRDQRQSAAAIERFWQVVLVSALGESLDRASLAAARKVFLDGFLAHREASQVLVPRVSLGALYDERVANWLRDRGAVIHLEAPVAEVVGTVNRATGFRLAGGGERLFDFAILAVPWQRVGELFSPALQSAIDPDSRFASIAAAPITGVHLWFDRPLTDLPHVVLVGRLSQWVFGRHVAHVGRGSPDPAHDYDRGSPGDEGDPWSADVARSGDRPQQGARSGGRPQRSERYYQVVISASHDLAGRERQSIIDEVLADLRAVFPAAAAAKILRWQLVTERDAVFSVRPGLDAIRPTQQTPIPNLLLAGDWTATGWPATMEGAIRSGYLAAEAVLTQLGRPERIVVPDLPRGWLVRLLGAGG